MYQVGDHVIYGHDGVCRVEEIGTPNQSGFDRQREYYRLMPQHRSGTIYVPVTGTRIVMRPPVAPEELNALLNGFEELPLLEDIPAEGRQAGEYYRLLLARHSCRELLQLCKTLHTRQHSGSRARSKLNTTDQRSLKTAEEMLLEEFAFVWDISLEEAGQRLEAVFEQHFAAV